MEELTDTLSIFFISHPHFIISAIILAFLNMSFEKNSNSVINKIRNYWKKDHRRTHSLIILASILLLVILVDFQKITKIDADFANNPIVAFSRRMGWVVLNIFGGILIPYLISLCFSKPRRGRVFNNISTIVIIDILISTFSYV